MLIKIIKWSLAVIAAVAADRISAVARSETGKGRWFASFSDISDYIDITRRRDGKIGGWLWIFITSFSLLLTLIVLSLFW